MFDLFSGLVKENEIGLSQGITKTLGIKQKSWIDVTPTELISSAKLISKKISGKRLSKKEITRLIQEISQNNLTQGIIPSLFGKN